MWLFRPSPLSPKMLSIMRIVVAFLFFTVGTMKMFHYPARTPPVGPYNPFTQIGLAAIIEVVGGTLVILGLATRPAAFIMSGEMAVAYFQTYADKGFFPIINGGQSAATFCWIFLYLAFAGGGPWSLDALLFAPRRDGPKST